MISRLRAWPCAFAIFFAAGCSGGSSDPATGAQLCITARFRSPADANGDNVYEVTFRVSDGRGGTADINAGITIRTSEFAPDQGSLTSISSFGIDEDDDLCIVSIGSDTFRVEAVE